MPEEPDTRSILILSPRQDAARELRSLLEADGSRTIVANSVGPSRKLIQRGDVRLVVLDAEALSDPVDPLAKALREAPVRPSLILIAPEAGLAPDALRDLEPDAILDDPADPGQLRRAVDRLTSDKRPEQALEILGRSDAMREIRETIAQIAATPVNILITGETGTGKTHIAQAIHRGSSRGDHPFLTVNCGAIPETLLESELFGHEKGAFTDARQQREGIFEAADGGTVFLDEIGEMSLSAQVRLLNVLESREITRLGSTRAVKVDVRLIAATNMDLQQAVREGRFRSDLYYRLKVVEIKVPPLRQRPEDLPLLVEQFIEQYAREHGVPPLRFGEDAMDMLRRHSWPGNIRELKNLIERLMVLSPDRQVGPGPVSSVLRDLSGDGADSNQSALPVPLDRASEDSYRDLLYWAVLEVARDVKELKSMLASQRSELHSLPAYNSSFTPVGDAEAEYSEAEVRSTDEAPGDADVIKPLEEVEREAIARALEATDGHRKKAAKLLKMPERTLYRKIRQFNL